MYFGSICRACCGREGMRGGGCLALELPVVDPHIGVAGRRLGQVQAGARDALVLPQAAALRVADGAMCDQDLAGSERTGVVLVDVGLGPKESDLKSQRLPVLGGQPAGDIPLLGAKLWMAAEVRGKYHRMVVDDRRIS